MPCMYCTNISHPTLPRQKKVPKVPLAMTGERDSALYHFVY